MQFKPDDVGAGVLEPLARLLGRPALARLRRAVHGERDDRRQPGRLDHLDRYQRLLAHENVSPMMKSTPASTAQPTCSSNMPRTVAADSGSPAVDVRVADVAGEQRAGLARDVAGDPRAPGG